VFTLQRKAGNNTKGVGCLRGCSNVKLTSRPYN
jgi:hypothetical protein